MKKVAIFAVSAALMLSSCGSYMASGAYAGSSLGSILGSAIGGLTNGPRGSDWGTIIGMAGGAVVGTAIGSAADKAQQERISDYHQRVMDREDARQSGYYNRQQESAVFLSVNQRTWCTTNPTVWGCSPYRSAYSPCRG